MRAFERVFEFNLPLYDRNLHIPLSSATACAPLPYPNSYSLIYFIVHMKLIGIRAGVKRHIDIDNTLFDRKDFKFI